MKMAEVCSPERVSIHLQYCPDFDYKIVFFHFQFRIGVNTFWCCTEKSTRCQATAIQNRNSVTKGAADHNHIPQVFDEVQEKVAITAGPTGLER